MKNIQWNTKDLKSHPFIYNNGQEEIVIQPGGNPLAVKDVDAVRMKQICGFLEVTEIGEEPKKPINNSTEPSSSYIKQYQEKKQENKPKRRRGRRLVRRKVTQ